MSIIQEKLKPDTTVQIAYDGTELDKPRFIVGYWSIRGLAAPIRMMLSASQVNHWVAMYDVLPEGEAGWTKTKWLADKAWLKAEQNPFINLPFLVDCATNTVMAQTNAILSCLGRELNMLGSTPLEQIKCEELLAELMDLRNAMVGFCYAPSKGKGPDGDKASAARLIASSSAMLDKFELHMSQKENKSYLVGTQLSAPDCHLWELLDQFKGLATLYDLPAVWGTDTARPNLGLFHASFAALPENQAYFQSKHVYTDLPYNNPYARFGSDPTSTPIRFAEYTRGQDTPWQQKGVMTEARTKR